MLPSAPSDPRAAWKFYRVCQAAATVLCLLAFLQVHTYAVVSDPAYYLALGRQVEESLSAGAWPRVFVAPLLPLLLGAMRLLLGPFAPYWVNAIVWPLAVLVMMRSVRRLTGSPVTAGLAGTALVAFLWGRNPGFGNFLLCPFREPPAVLLSWLALDLLIRDAGATPPGRPPGWMRPFFAGLLLVLAGATREPFLVLLPPAALLAAQGAGGGARRRIGHAAAVCAPALAAVILAFAIPSVRALLLGGQAWMYLRRMLADGLAPSPFAAAAWRVATRSLAVIPALAAVALLAGPRRAAWRMGWGLGALLLLLAHAPIRDHERYALVVVLFLWPPAVAGLRQLWIRYHFPRDGRGAWPAFAATVVAGLAALPRLHGWGLPADADAVRRVIHHIAEADPATVQVDPRCRPMATVVGQFGHWPSPRHPLEVLRRPGRHLFVRPDNDYATAGRARGYDGMDVEALLAQHFELQPVGEPFRFDLAAFQLMETAPFRPGSVSIPMPEAYGPSVLWLDFRASRLTHAASLALPNTDWQPGFPTPAGPGWQGLALEVPFTGATEWVFSSSGPFPSNLRPRWATPGHPAVFFLDDQRAPSDLAWLERPPRGAAADKYPAALADRLTLRIPPFTAAEPLAWKITVAGSALRRPSGPVALSADAGDIRVPGQYIGRPSRYKHAYIRADAFTLPPGATRFTLRAEPPFPPDAPLRLHELRLEPVSASPR